MASEHVPVLTQRQLARSIKGKMSRPVKNVLCTPYKVVWPNVDRSTQEAILGELKRSFSEINLTNPLAQDTLYRRLNKEQRRCRKEEFLAKSEQTPEDINTRQQLVFGVTEVTKALERNTLRLVVVNRSSPWQLHRHLAQLSAIRGCPAVALDRVSDALSSLVSVTKMCAFGFKMKKDKDCNYFDSTISFISSRCPSVEIPWLECEKALMVVKCEAPCLEEKEVEANSGQEDLSLSGAAERFVKDQKDFSHLYVKKSSNSGIKVESKILNSEWTLDDNAVLDDMWGKRNKKFQSKHSGNGAKQAVQNEKQKNNATVTGMPEQLSRKRAYCEMNIKNVVKCSKNKKK